MSLKDHPLAGVPGMTRDRAFSLFVAVLALGGCASLPEARDPALSELVARQHPVISSDASAVPERHVGDRQGPLLFKGEDLLIGSHQPRARVTEKGDAVSLRFEQAPIAEVIHTVLGDLLKIDYSLASPLVGQISLHTHEPVERSQILPLLESVLHAKGVVMVADAGGRLQIGPADILRTAIPLPAGLGKLTAGYSAVVVPLRFVGAIEMREILRSVLAPENVLRVDAARNLLLLSGTGTQIEAWMEIVKIFDVDFLKGMSVGLFPLEHAPVREVDAALRTLFASSDGDRSERPVGDAIQSTARPQGLEFGGPLSGLVRVLPVERLNALLVVTPRAHYLEQARIWIERLDRPLDSDTEPQLYVYPVQNGSSVHLAGLIGGVFGGTVSTTQSTEAGTRDSGVAPGLPTTAVGSVGASQGRAIQGGAGLTESAPANSGSAQTRLVSIADVRVIADEHNNALLIFAPRKEYRRIQAALRQLDVAPTQVLIEASILEVTLSDELKYGLQWYFDGRVGGSYSGRGQFTAGDSSAIGPVNPGFSYSIINSAGAVRAVLSALAQKNLLNVISSPSILVLDNHTARIQVGDQQPVRTSTTISDSNSVVTENIQYKDTGVMLSVQPSVNAGGLVSMVVQQNLTDVGAEVDSATGQRPFLQRQISTRVAVRTGETVVLGGLIRDNSTRARQGLPLLHDVPVLGNLFGATNVRSNRTELLILITPRVMRNDQDLRELNSELSARMHAIREFSGRLRPGDLPVSPSQQGSED